MVRLPSPKVSPLSFELASKMVRTALALVCVSAPVAAAPASAEAAPVRSATRTVLGVPVRVVAVDLADPQTRLTIGLANNAPRANSALESFGAESFGRLVSRANAAVVMNGTFFSKDHQRRVMGNVVRNGEVVKYSQWEDAGTTFGLKAGNAPEMITARAEGKPDWQSHWFSLTCGPRLVKDGGVWLHPREEGFTDPHVLGVASRNALGYTRDGRTLYLVSFGRAVSLAHEARIMQALGCHQAMNLDGGTSKGLALHGRTVIRPSRALTNVIAVYDAERPAPAFVEAAWNRFAMLGTAGRPERAAAIVPGDRFVQRLNPGRKLAYGNFHLEHVSADPIVGVQSGHLTFSPRSYGQVFAPLPAIQRDFTLEFDARLIDEYFSVFFDARKGEGALEGLSLEYRGAEPAGLYLRENGRLVTYAKWVAVDENWHKFRVVAEGQQVKVFMDNSWHPTLSYRRPTLGQGIGFAGRGVYKGLRVLVPSQVGRRRQETETYFVPDPDS